MKRFHIALNTLLYFLYMFGSCVIVMLVESMLVFFIDKFVPISYPVLTVIRIVIYTLGVTALMAVIGYYEGYREGHCSIAETIVSGVAAMIPHLLLSMLFKFQDFVSGAVRFTAGLLYNGWSITFDSLINQTPYSLFLAIFAVYGLIYIGALTIAKYFGAQKRIVDRAELRMHESPDAAE